MGDDAMNYWETIQKQKLRIARLERENRELRAELESTRQQMHKNQTLMIDGVIQHERMLLQMIVNGNIRSGDHRGEGD